MRLIVHYNSFLVFYRELASGTVSLTGDRAQGDDNKHYLHYTVNSEIFARILFSRKALKHILVTLKIRDKGVIYLYK